MDYKMKYLNIVTALCCTTLISIFLSFHQNNTYASYIEIDSKTGRNERSTPRTFILPATPAIADEQERRLVLMSKKEQIQKCMLKLYDLGFKDFDKRCLAMNMTTYHMSSHFITKL